MIVTEGREKLRPFIKGADKMVARVVKQLITRKVIDLTILQGVILSVSKPTCSNILTFGSLMRDKMGILDGAGMGSRP